MPAYLWYSMYLQKRISHQWSTPKRSFSYSVIDFRTCTQNYVVPVERNLGTTHLFFFQRLLYGWGEVYHLPKKIHPLFFFGTHANTPIQSLHLYPTALRRHGPEGSCRIPWECLHHPWGSQHGCVACTSSVVKRIRSWCLGMKVFIFAKKKGKAHRKTLRCNYTTPRMERHFFSKREQMVILLIHSYMDVSEHSGTPPNHPF